jgi:hypothetical protein
MKMKKLVKKLENIFAAAAFAESGEAETAREIIRERKTVDNQLRKRTDKEKRTRVTAN